MKEFENLRGFIDGITGTMLPGAAVRVYQAGKSLLEYHAGCADAENGIELIGDELYPGYSVTKLMTGVCVFKAYEEGRLDINAPLSDYIEQYAHMSYILSGKDGKRILPCAGRITLKQLLSHTGGIGNGFPEKGDTLSSVRALARKPLLFEPGTRWLYGLSHDVLGAVLETVYSEKLRGVFKKLICEPLGLSRTRFLSEETDVSNIIPMYRAAGDGFERMALDYSYTPSPAYDSGGAGILTTCGEYAVFLNALCTGRLLRPETLDLMTQDALCPQARRDFCWPQTAGYTFGLGIRVPPVGSTLTDCGWGGAAGAYTLMDISKGVSMCFFTNVLGANETVLYPNLRDLLYKDLTQVDLPR